eukprot:m.143449 g.143449  ORF g.143449 m.143449 type:complete len:322 (+) comp30320_c0_seq1:2145-3110(+)
MYNLACTLDHLKQRDEAFELTQEALTLQKGNLRHPVTADLMNMLFELEKYDESRAVCQQVIMSQKQVLPQEHSDIASSMNHINKIAIKFFEQKRYDAALKLLEDVVEFQKQVQHPDLAHSINNKANFLCEMKRYHDSLEANQEALKLQKRDLPLEHPDIASSMNTTATIASWLYTLERYGAAAKLYKRVLVLRKRVLPLDHLDVADSMERLGNVHLALKKFKLAFKHSFGAFDIFQRRQPPKQDKMFELAKRLMSICDKYQRHSKTEQSPADNDPNQCSCSNPTCSKLNPLKTCTGCRTAKYCDNICQRSHWKITHMHECK